jgi:UDP-glucuronate 4-epimerase
MAYFKFVQAIEQGKPIDVYNFGDMRRDFTYIDDIIEGLVKVAAAPALPNYDWTSDNPDPGTSKAPWRLYNIGNNCPINLMDYIIALEKALGKKAKKNYLPIQPGDVLNTYANVDDLVKKFNYKPKTTVEDGINKFVEWFKKYYEC